MKLLYIYTYICNYENNVPSLYYTHLDFVRFEYSVCRGLLMTTYTYNFKKIFLQ